MRTDEPLAVAAVEGEYEPPADFDSPFYGLMAWVCGEALAASALRRQAFAEAFTRRFELRYAKTPDSQ